MKNPVYKLLLFYILLIVFIIGCSIVFPSCEVLKKRTSVSVDSLKTVKVDSGKVVVNSINNKDSLAWWREILSFSRDTNIINPVTNVYPTSYIREGGVRTIETKTVNYDSLWNNRLDSLSFHLNREDKSKEVKFMSFWQIVAVAAGVGLVFFLLGKVKFSLK